MTGSERSLPQPRDDGDLTVTALYTSQAWVWAGFDAAELFDWRPSRAVFRATNAAIGLARLLRPDAPSLRHGLAQRHAMIDHLARASGVPQILELACGLGRRGASFSRDRDLRYVEVDLPGVVARKRWLLERTAAGREVLERPNWDLLPGDARTMDLSAILQDGPVFVIVEGLLMYLDAEAQRTLWRRVATLLAERPGSAFAFDLVPAVERIRPGWVGRALGWLMRRFTRGRGFEIDARTRDNLRDDLLAAGFSEVAILEPADLCETGQIPYLDRETSVLLFRCTTE